MRRIAANRIYTATDTYYDTHIVELADGCIKGIYPLREEQPMTEWMTGIVVITDKSIADFGMIKNIQDFYTKERNNTETAHATTELKAYHITGIPHRTADMSNAQVKSL